MKSIKPGRGPSAMGVVGGIVAIIFGIFWTILAYTITQQSPFPMVGTIFPLFGLIFVGIGIVNVIYHYKNVTSKERMSIVDIVDASEEGDPRNRKFGNFPEKKFCPYCGTPVEEDFVYCPRCGKDMKSSN